MDLSNRVAVVTGGGRGIGREISLKLAGVDLTTQVDPDFVPGPSPVRA